MKNQKTFYGPAERPPLMLTIFSSIQHMLLVLSLGLALPVTVARAASDPDGIRCSAFDFTAFHRDYRDSANIAVTLFRQRAYGFIRQ